MNSKKLIKILLVILCALPIFVFGSLQANESTIVARGGERAHVHPAAAGHHVNHPAARAYGRGAEAGAAVNGAAGVGGVAEPAYYQQPVQTTTPQPIIIENTTK